MAVAAEQRRTRQSLRAESGPYRVDGLVWFAARVPTERQGKLFATIGEIADRHSHESHATTPAARWAAM